jgi:hypothetical protein
MRPHYEARVQFPNPPHAYAKIVQRIKDCLSEVKRIPVEVLILEPSGQSSSPLAAVRTGLRNELRGSGHAAYFREDSCDTGPADSIRLQQLA